MSRPSIGLKFISRAALAAVAVWLQACWAPKVMVPKDQELIAIFYAQRQAFEELQQMAAEDAQRGWYLGASDPNILDQSRRDEYKNLISKIRPGLLAAMNGRTGVVRFIFAIKGVAIGPGWVKGIEYLPEGYGRSEGILLTNLDDASSQPANVYIRQIEPGWFLFYQRDE